MRIFFDVIMRTVEEIKGCLRLARDAKTNRAKATYMSLVYMNLLFLPVYLIPLLYTFVIVIGAIFYGPILLVGLLINIPFVLFVLWIKVKVYPVMKRNLLNKNISA